MFRRLRGRVQPENTKSDTAETDSALLVKLDSAAKATQYTVKAAEDMLIELGALRREIQNARKAP